jgi:hypothetical protein
MGTVEAQFVWTLIESWVGTVSTPGWHLIETWSGTVSTPPPALPDFAVSVSPASGSVQQGSSISTTVTVTGINGYDLIVSLTAAGQPSTVTIAFNPSSSIPDFSSTMTISAGPSAAVGNYTITIIGAGSDGKVRMCTYSLTITAPPTPPPGPPSGPTTPVRGHIVAELKVTLLKKIYSPGETAQALVDINNTAFTQNDVILRISIRDIQIYTSAEQVTNITPGMNQRILDIKVPENLTPSEYLVHVEMIQPDGTVNWGSDPFTLVSVAPPIPVDLLIILALLAILIVVGVVRRWARKRRK